MPSTQEPPTPIPGGKTKEGDDEAELVVDWEGSDDPLNPKNWSARKKWGATLVVSAFALISPVSSSMIAPASQQVAQEFGVTDEVVIGLITSIFLLAYAFGPLLLGPLSEMFGRNIIIQGANMWYLCWNLGCGFLVIGGGVLGDIWDAEERGQALAIYSLAPLLGPVIGPLCGAFIAERSTWRWVFWSTTIFDAAILVLGIFYLRESYAPFILGKKAKRVRESLGAGRRIRSKFDGEDRTWQRLLRTALTRPFILFYREPIIQLLGIYLAFVYGLLYLFLTSMPLMFRGTYHETVGISGLNYLALGIGITAASQISARLMDRIYKRLKEKRGDAGQPEYRLPAMVPGTILLPAGLLLTGWTVQAKVHWIAPDIGIALIGAGIILNYQVIQIYIVDAFTLYAASALASVSVLRFLCGFGFPLFAEQLFAKLGYGKGNTVLAVIAIVIGCPAPWLLWKYGKQIRTRSIYAQKQQIQ
ncbi:MFS polyamine transporter [Mycena filopes]|nr:MFS polyamine transporter [Mycena filopes]